jgi:hypothetical protein
MRSPYRRAYQRVSFSDAPISASLFQTRLSVRLFFRRAYQRVSFSDAPISASLFQTRLSARLFFRHAYQRVSFSDAPISASFFQTHLSARLYNRFLAHALGTFLKLRMIIETPGSVLNCAGKRFEMCREAF